MKVGILLFLIFGMWIGLGVLSPATVQAELITIGIEAVVFGVEDSRNELEGRINIGDLITGTYSYDTDTPDLDSSAGVGKYRYYDYPYGFSLSVAGLDFKTEFSPDVPCLPGRFQIKIENDVCHVTGRCGDAIHVSSHGGYCGTSATIGAGISLLFTERFGTALSDTELPTTAPVLSDWGNSLVLGGDYEHRFWVYSHVTSAVVIPEPASILLLGLGGLVFTRRTKK